METTEYAALIVIIKSSAREDNTNDIYAKKCLQSARWTTTVNNDAAAEDADG